MTNRQKLSILFHTARIEKGLSMREVAKQLNINRTTYSAYEEMRSEPPFILGLRICKLLGIDIERFYNERLSQSSPAL